jgi:uncharacterized membrane protein
MAADPELLKDVPLFQTLDDAERTAVAALMTETRFPAGATLFREHDPGGVMYLIRDGRVELWVTDEDRAKVVIDVLHGSDFFGELTLLDGGLRSTGATALEDLECLALERRPFMELLARRPEMALDLLAALTKRIRKADELLKRRVRNPNEVLEERLTLGDRVADAVARFGGSWAFMFTFAGVLAAWMLLNTAFVVVRQRSGEPFDPYPFILLNLGLSMLAAVQGPVIMMSQNRQDKKDRVRSELEYQVNVRAEFGVQQLNEKVESIARGLEQRLDRLEDQRSPR